MEIRISAADTRGNVEIEMGDNSNVVEPAQAVAIMEQLKGQAEVVVIRNNGLKIHFSVADKAFELAGITGLATAKHGNEIRF